MIECWRKFWHILHHIAYYESARCLHGRMKPLQGAYYVNLFAHYRPIGDPKWYRKTNPEGSIAPALDIGKCTANSTKAVCDGAYSVPYLSPSLDRFYGAMDLYKYWEQSGELLQKNTPVGVSVQHPITYYT